MRFDKLEFDVSRREIIGKEMPVRIERDAHYWLKKADDKRRTGCYETALRFYSRALENDKTFVPAWTAQIQMLVQLGEYPQARLWSQKALDLFPANGDLIAGHAQAECRLGNVTKSQALSDGALLQRGESAYRWQVRGEVMVAGGRPTDGHCFDKAQLADSDWLVPLESAIIYSYYKAFGLAQQRAQLAVERAPQAYYAWYLLGVCQLKLGCETPARTSFQRCLELCPRHDEAISRLAELQRPRWSLFGLFGRFIGR